MSAIELKVSVALALFLLYVSRQLLKETRNIVGNFFDRELSDAEKNLN